MQERPENSDIFAQLESYSKEHKDRQWKGTFEDYIRLVQENPSIAKSSHQVLYQMVLSNGVEDKKIDGEAVKSYTFFESGKYALYGIEKPVAQFVELLHAGAENLEPKRRILLLMGPPGGGKSTLVSALKKGLEEFSRTDEGAIYAIDGCPLNEEPLHLIPPDMRPKAEKQLGVKIEGDLCPVCAISYPEFDTDNRRKAPIKRIFLSESQRVGIGTFSPSDPKSQDMSELIGQIDFSKIAEYGNASDPRAFKFDGELNVANRGVMEFIEMFKADERFLYILLSLAQERVIKAPRFPLISADEVILAHTNQNEYERFVKKPESEALRDRIIVITIPYNLKVSAERKIYQKLLGEHAELRNVHISPRTLEIAATYAVLSRLKDPKKADTDRVKKMKIYDGKQLEGSTTLADLRELKQEFENEGMDGISPRYVIDRLSGALIHEGRQCLSPIAALRALRDGLDHHAHTRDLPPEKKKELAEDLIQMTRELFDEIAREEVQKAFIHGYRENAQTVLNGYLANVEAFLHKTKMTDSITDEEIDPDETFMRAIEEQIGVAENGKREFRQEIMTNVATTMRRGDTFEYESHPRLRDAIQKYVFEQIQDAIKITTSPTKDPEQQKKINEVVSRLVEDDGYCNSCATELVQYVGTQLRRAK